MVAKSGAGNRGMTLGSENSKKAKPKGNLHELHYDILDDPKIKVESNWEEEVKYWTSKMCKKYVKMYHIGKFIHHQKIESSPMTW